MKRSRILIPGWLALAVVGCAVVGAVPVGAAELSEQRFTEIGFGVSLRPPLDGELVDSPGDGAVGMWRLDEGYTLSLRIAASREAFEKLAEVVGQAWAGSWLGLAAAQPRFVNQEPREIAGRPGMVQTAELEQKPPAFLGERQRQEWEGEPFFYGQAAMKLDPFTLAIVEVYAPEARAGEAEALLTAVVDSVEVMPVEQLFDLRRSQLEAAQAWLADFDLRAALQRAPGDAWFSLSEDGEEVGYARRGFETDPRRVRELKFAMQESGVASASFMAHRRGGLQMEVREDAYADDRGELETWSRHSLVRSKDEGGGLFAQEGKPAVWSETGLRQDRVLTLVHKSPPDADAVREVKRAEHWRGLPREWTERDLLYKREQVQFEIPDRLFAGQLDDRRPIPPTEVYVGQVGLSVLPQALPRGRSGAFAFYAYDKDTGTLSLRTYEVAPTGDGGAWVTERPTPGSSPTRHRIDARGRVAEVVLPGRLHLARTTREVLAARWPEVKAMVDAPRVPTTRRAR